MKDVFKPVAIEKILDMLAVEPGVVDAQEKSTGLISLILPVPENWLGEEYYNPENPTKIIIRPVDGKPISFTDPETWRVAVGKHVAEEFFATGEVVRLVKTLIRQTDLDDQNRKVFLIFLKMAHSWGCDSGIWPSGHPSKHKLQPPEKLSGVLAKIIPSADSDRSATRRIRTRVRKETFEIR